MEPTGTKPIDLEKELKPIKDSIQLLAQRISGVEYIYEKHVKDLMYPSLAEAHKRIDALENPDLSDALGAFQKLRIKVKEKIDNELTSS